MSLVRPAELSATPYRDHKLYSLNGSNENSGLSTQIFGSDKRKTMYMTDSYSSESYEKYFIDSPTEELIRPSSSSISGNSFHLLDASSYQPRIGSGSSITTQDPCNTFASVRHCGTYQLNSESDYLEIQSPDPVDYDADEMRRSSQRIAAYMVEGLAARMASSGKYLYKALKCKEPPSSDRLAAMQILFEVCPCFKFGFMAANGAIIEAFKGEKRVHIIDFDINQGSQYITLIQTLANQPGKPPYLRLTGVDDPESVQRPIGGLKIIGQRLEKLAEAFKVPFEFHAVASKTSLVSPSMLDCKPGEALVMNFAFQLHHMPDESVSTVNERDQLLRMVKSLNPKLVTVVEQDVNTNTAPFFQRFVDAYNYYSAVFDSLDATLPRESQDRINVEKQCLARDIVNIVACEGDERIERYEVAGKWRARMMMAGFTSCSMGPNVVDMIRKLIKQYCDRYTLKEEMGALLFGWEDKSLIVSSAWR
ncbi:hypothetical protein GH714_000645 [Hevea brasiliensis]|uniref:Uncharacterized protein n=1 Tax=Hevea brasiliensis TaxID=3981 RepID=A0A6A6L5D1_HEVBR|nr:hypothetical protein GH714_000645 [Hevea brasiliensis]